MEKYLNEAYRLNIVEIILMGVFFAGLLLLIVSLIAWTWSGIVKYFTKANSWAPKVKQKPTNKFKTHSEVADLKDGAKSIGLLLLIVIFICVLTHGM